MVPIPMSTLPFAGHTTEMAGGTSGIQPAGDAFGKARDKAAAGTPSAQSVAEQSVSVTSKDGIPTTSAVNPVDSVLKPKLEATGHLLGTVRQQVTNVTGPNASNGLTKRLTQIEKAYQSAGKNITQTATGNDPMQMLKLQNDIYQMDEELELLSKAVEEMTSGMKTVLQMQV